MSSRRQVLAALRYAWTQVGGARYEVKRGPVDWPNWNFDAFPYGVSLVVPEGPLDLPAQFFGQRDSKRELTVAMTAFWRVPGNPQEVDDAIPEEIGTHVAHAIALVFESRDPQGQPLIHSISPDTSNVDAFDAQLKVQGIVAVITFNYTE